MNVDRHQFDSSAPITSIHIPQRRQQQQRRHHADDDNNNDDDDKVAMTNDDRIDISIPMTSPLHDVPTRRLSPTTEKEMTSATGSSPSRKTQQQQHHRRTSTTTTKPPSKIIMTSSSSKPKTKKKIKEVQQQETDDQQQQQQQYTSSSLLFLSSSSSSPSSPESSPISPSLQPISPSRKKKMTTTTTTATNVAIHNLPPSDLSYSSTTFREDRDDPFSFQQQQQQQQVEEESEQQNIVPQHEQQFPIEVIEQPASGTDPNHLKRPVKMKKGLETDFFLNPTILSRLILNQKYAQAIKRIFEEPEEASTWLCAKRNITFMEITQQQSLPEPSSTSTSSPNNKDNATTYIHSIRQLPIHLACSNFGRGSRDTATMSLLNELVSLLVFAYPEGAHTEDHRHIYPIQEAIWYGAAPETIALFLMAKPEALLIVDHHGRSLGDLNKHRTGIGKDAIQRMLDRDIQFWKVARDEAALRLQHNKTVYPSEGSIGSESVLASPNLDEETIITIKEIQKSFYEENVTPLAWDQLEQRTRATEQILTSVNEENYRLRQQIENMNNKKASKNTELLEEFRRLERENSMLNEKIYQMEKLLEKRCVTDDEEKNEQFRLALAEVSSLVGLSVQSSLFSGFQQSVDKSKDDNETRSRKLYNEAKQIQKHLSKKQLEQREKLRKLRHMLSYSVNEDSNDNNYNNSDIERDSSSSYIEVDTISALSLETAKSDVSRLIHKQRFHYNEGVVDRLPHQYQGHRKLDDLIHILRVAAARPNKVDSPGGGQNKQSSSPLRQQKQRTTDDLSAVLKWAARKDRRDLFFQRMDELESVESNYSPVNPKDIWNPNIPPKVVRVTPAVAKRSSNNNNNQRSSQQVDATKPTFKQRIQPSNSSTSSSSKHC